MKATNHFKNTIQAYLDQRAAGDPLFEWTYTADTKKNIDDCITYILNTVQNSGCNGFHDDEIFGMAVHYYDEPNIEIGKPMHNAQVTVNHFLSQGWYKTCYHKESIIKRLQLNFALNT